MCEWDVYVDGQHVGTVQETCETLARCAALYKFVIAVDSDLAVSKRIAHG